MFRRYTAPIALVLAAPATAIAPSTWAQDTSALALEEVLVTARKREENIQDTPISVTAISSEMIEQAKMFKVADLEQHTPNLTIRSSDNGVSSALQAYLRGVGQFDFALTVDPGVGMYVDGVYLARTVGANFQLSDIEQIQVLRGPQGTLFGKNTIGGAINVTTRRPSGDTLYSAGLTGGEDNYISFDGYLEFPITDEVAASVAVLTKNSDGWQERDRGDDAGNDGMWAVRGHLDADFTDAWNSHLVLDYTSIDQNVYPQVLTDFDPSAIFASTYNLAVLGPRGESCCEPHPNDIYRSKALNELDKEQNDTLGLSWTNTFDLGGLTLKSITGYRDMDSESYRDADNNVYDYFSVGSVFDVQQFSQEFVLIDETGGTFDWLVGLYYLNEDGEHGSTVTIAGGLYEALAALPLFVTTPTGVPLAFLAVPLDLTLFYDRAQETTSYAAFFNTTWHLSGDARLNVAARYTYDEKDMDMYTIKLASQTPLLIPRPTSPDVCTDAVADGLGGSNLSCNEDWDEFSPRIGLDYDFNEDVMGYASISGGFRSGVYNGRPTATDQVSVADPETLVSYELGLKSMLWDNRLQLNGALFYNDYEDRQFLVNRPSGSAESALSLVVANAADSTLWGGELEFTLLATQGLTISGGLSYIDPEYKDFESFNTATGELEDLSHRPFSNVPEWTANLLAQYVYKFHNGDELRLRGNLAYKDDIHYSDDEQSNSFERLHADSYTIFNAGVTYVTTDQNWEFSFFGRNLGDEQEIRGGFGVDAFGTTTVSYTEPRRYFFSVKYRN
ncbi:MAG: TonB-dependent receptor [Halieaceae bacterium]|nr:TonB-dependent receptor [Halieaceae bacterium]